MPRKEETARWFKVLDASSQLLNVALLPNHRYTTPNESVSGRAHRCGWKLTEKFINLLFLAFETDHCKKSNEADIQRAKDWISDNLSPGTQCVIESSQPAAPAR